MKLAKFALHCDGEKVTSLEQLKEHFNLLDILEHYKSGTLHRWLKSRGYASELEGVEAIKATEDADILNALCGVFGIEESKESIQDMLENHKDMQEKEALETEKEALRAEIASLKAQLKTLQSPPHKTQRSLAKH
ncbi:hypothetical protein NHP190003_07630 [Helicobacter sp. NHP19-003]|uniref:Uncharacterized protein n=1 Tax=Helicobacter gastrocanis TaxID=2849641 RepID=A0ABM7SAV4_9HELI|nr:DUF4349 domain-containing protein [Helicobacter sp. NHP19-003]BCZ17481.1 hypothetical protein NHP190003_07630 [Helicobacter sp. NHP19-003]